MFSVGIVIFDGVEMRDFSALHEVFTTASAIHARLNQSRKLFQCFLIAENLRTIATRGGVKIIPDCPLPPAAEVDVLIVPGGRIAEAAHRPALMDWMGLQSGQALATIAVSEGTALLAKAMPLSATGSGRPLTDAAAVLVGRNSPVHACIRGAASIDVGLELVESLSGSFLAQETARHMEYPWEQGGTGKASQHNACRR